MSITKYILIVILFFTCMVSFITWGFDSKKDGKGKEYLSNPILGFFGIPLLSLVGWSWITVTQLILAGFVFAADVYQRSCDGGGAEAGVAGLFYLMVEIILLIFCLVLWGLQTMRVYDSDV